MPKRFPRIKATPSDLRKRMGYFLGLVRFGGNTVYIGSRGKIWAVLCPPENWSREHPTGHAGAATSKGNVASEV
jgi:hypothetical protein